MGGAVFPSLLFTLGQTMVEVMKIMVTSLKRSHACTATLSGPSLQQTTTNQHLHRRLLDTHRQVRDSLLWGHCSFLLGPDAQGSVCALQESTSQSCVSSGSSMVGLMATSPKRTYAIPTPRAPAPAVVHC